MTNADSRVTLLLAVKDRLPLAHRWMRFMDQEQCPYRIIVADGSLDNDSGRFFANTSDFPNLAYEYIRFAPDKNYSDFFRKVSTALDLVDTPYVLMADDDDFYCLEGIRTAMGFLDEHPDFVCARGSYLGFSVETSGHGEEVTGAHTVYGEMRFKGAIYPSTTIAEDTSAGRMAANFSRWTPTWYSIHRTDIWRACWNEVAALNLMNIFLFEHTLTAMVAARGKIFAGQYPYYYRQVDGSYVTSSQEAKNRNGDWFDQMLSEYWSADYAAFVNLVSTDIANRDGISKDAAITLVNASYRNYYGPNVASVLSVRRGAAEEKMARFYWRLRSLLSICVKTYRASRPIMRALKTNQSTVRLKIFLANKN